MLIYFVSEEGIVHATCEVNENICSLQKYRSENAKIKPNGDT